MVSVRALAVVLLLVRVREVSDCVMAVLGGVAPSRLVRRDARAAMVWDMWVSWDCSVSSWEGEVERAMLKTSW